MVINTQPKTLFDRIWDSHLVDPPGEDGIPAVLYIDLHLLHEVTSPHGFAELEQRGLRVRCPSRTLATMDHSTPTDSGITLPELRVIDAAGAAQLEQLAHNCEAHGIPLYGLGSERRGIVHVMAPELGLTQPGMTVVCGDSHTSTHGAFGTLAFGIGSSEVGHVLATQSLLQQKPKTLEIRVEGSLPRGVTAKDLILAIIRRIGVHGGTGHVIEYTGQAIRQLDMEGRMTICNMSIEGGAKAGMIAPDEVTFEYLRGRPFAPTGDDWDRALEDWRSLPTDSAARFDQRVIMDAAELEPMITYGTNPGMAVRLVDSVPDPAGHEDARAAEKALDYMGLKPGQPILGAPLDVVFVGSCTNGRLSDLRQAAGILEGRQVAPQVRMLVVPGSETVKRQAEQEGLHEIFLAAGAEWRSAGCSMCIALNNDRVQPGQYAVSTTNRNFEGRQGAGARTFLASPLTAAASAVAGAIADPRELL
jgi:3-isopropylmalate/(R)-2-methylmalate dehydratase large subunit